MLSLLGLGTNVPLVFPQRFSLAALALGGFWGLCRRLSPHQAARFGGWVLALLGPRSRKHSQVLANLRRVVPEADAETLHRLAGQNWWHLGATLAEYPHLATLATHHLTVRGTEHLSGSGPYIFVAAHLGNWELAIAAICRQGLAVDAVYNPQADMALDARVQRERQAMSCGFIPRVQALRLLMKSLRSGRSVGLLVDYRIEGTPLVALLGQPAATTTTPAWLAARTRAAIVPIAVERLASGGYQARFHPPIPGPDPAAGEAAVLATTVMINERIGAFIAANPSQWWCTKRRWPKERQSADARQ